MPRKKKDKTVPAAPVTEVTSPLGGEVPPVVDAPPPEVLPPPVVDAPPPEVKMAVTEPAVSEISAPSVVKEEFVDVVSPCYQWEPFQKIAIQPGVPTPVRLTSWVQCQLDAKVLRRG